MSRAEAQPVAVWQLVATGFLVAACAAFLGVTIRGATASYTAWATVILGAFVGLAIGRSLAGDSPRGRRVVLFLASTVPPFAAAVSSAFGIVAVSAAVERGFFLFFWSVALCEFIGLLLWWLLRNAGRRRHTPN